MSLGALVVGLTLVTLSGTAWALDEGQWQIGFAPQLTADFYKGLHHGGGARMDGRYGITDAISGWAAWGRRGAGVARRPKAATAPSVRPHGRRS